MKTLTPSRVNFSRTDRTLLTAAVLLFHLLPAQGGQEDWGVRESAGDFRARQTAELRSAASPNLTPIRPGKSFYWIDGDHPPLFTQGQGGITSVRGLTVINRGRINSRGDAAMLTVTCPSNGRLIAVNNVRLINLGRIYSDGGGTSGYAAQMAVQGCSGGYTSLRNNTLINDGVIQAGR
ncbi:MAG: hypothetical protein AB2809_18360 [Candidatus Thiodiazotropha sp.]